MNSATHSSASDSLLDCLPFQSVFVFECPADPKTADENESQNKPAYHIVLDLFVCAL